MTNTAVVLPEVNQYQVTGPIYGDTENSSRLGSAWKASQKLPDSDRLDSVALLQQTVEAELEAKISDKDEQEQTFQSQQHYVTTDVLPEALQSIEAFDDSIKKQD